MTIGENIKKARKDLGLTQKELGKRLGITQSAVGQFEKSDNLNQNTLRKIADALEIPLHRLYDENFDTAVQKMLISNLMETEVFPEEDWQLDIILAKAIEINEEGRYKIIEYEDDLILSGKYKKEPEE